MNIFDILRKKIIQQKENDELYELYAGPQETFEDVIKIINQVEQRYNDGWIPLIEERYPENDSYILLSFTNFTIPIVGRYEEDEDGGAFFAGDEDIPLVSQGMIVNAWRPLPAIYIENMQPIEQRSEDKIENAIEQVNDLLTKVIDEVVRIADNNEVSRDELLEHFMAVGATFSQVSTLKNYELKQ